MKTPNEADPLNNTTGVTDEEYFYNTVYEQFPWLASVDDMLKDDAMHSGQPNGGVKELIEFISNLAFVTSADVVRQDMGEYVNHLENEVAQAEALAKKTTKAMKDLVVEWETLWGWSSSGEMT